MMGQMSHVVIIGCGFGGLYAAKKLCKRPVQITILDRSNHHLFQPLLYQVATAGLSPSDIAQPIRSIFRGYENVEVLLAEVTGVNTNEKQVVLSDGQMAYDFLIIAAGATHAYFGHDDWSKIAPGLKSLEDAVTIRRMFLTAFEEAEKETTADRRKALLNFVIVGAGPTGVELAGTMRDIAQHSMAKDFRHIDSRKARVILLEGGPRVLPAFSEKLSASAQRQLEKLGVQVRTNSLVTRVESDCVYVGEERIETKRVFWAAGVAASSLGRSLAVELDRSGRVKVQPDLSISDHPEIFVIGDLASLVDARGQSVPGVAPAAMQMGSYAAQTILAKIRGEQPPAPFIYRDKGSLATIGRAAAVAMRGNLQFSGLLAWLAWLGIHILFLIGFRNRLMVLIQWAWAYIGFQTGARLITYYHTKE